MKTVVKTATEARREFFELMNAALYGGQETVVTKNGRPAIKIVRVGGKKESKGVVKKTDWKKVDVAMDRLRGNLTEEDFGDMERAGERLNEKRFPDW